MIERICLPCLEQPSRCKIRSKIDYQRKLCITGDGRVGTTKKIATTKFRIRPTINLAEEYYIIPVLPSLPPPSPPSSQFLPKPATGTKDDSKNIIDNAKDSSKTITSRGEQIVMIKCVINNRFLGYTLADKSAKSASDNNSTGSASMTDQMMVKSFTEKEIQAYYDHHSTESLSIIGIGLKWKLSKHHNSGGGGDIKNMIDRDIPYSYYNIAPVEGFILNEKLTLCDDDDNNNIDAPTQVEFDEKEEVINQHTTTATTTIKNNSNTKNEKSNISINGIFMYNNNNNEIENKNNNNDSNNNKKPIIGPLRKFKKIGKFFDNINKKSAEIIEKNDNNINNFLAPIDEVGLLTDNSTTITTCNSSSDNSNINKTEKISQQQEWILEFQTGELCFISSPMIDRRIRCDLAGTLSMKENWKGWEVWSFIEVDDGDGIRGGGGGYVKISSWAHSTKYLASNEQGAVFTTKALNDEKNNHNNEHLLWSVEKARIDATKAVTNGVIIRSKLYKNRILRFDSKNKLYTSDDDVENFSIWHLEAAHSQIYYMSPLSDMNRRIGVSNEKAYTTNLPIKQPSEEWKIDVVVGGDFLERSNKDKKITVTLLSPSKSKYLCCNEYGELYISSHATESSGGFWVLQEHNSGGDGGIMFVSCQEHILNADNQYDNDKITPVSSNSSISNNNAIDLSLEKEDNFDDSKNKNANCLNNNSSNNNMESYMILRRLLRILSVDKEGNLCTVQAIITTAAERTKKTTITTYRPRITCNEIWNLIPRTPRHMTPRKIRSIGITTAVAVAVGTTVAAPYVITNAIGYLGFAGFTAAEVGLSAEVLAGGVIAAQSAISIAAVGTTTRTLLQSTNVATAKEEEKLEEETNNNMNNIKENSTMNRPFCAWRTWQ